MNNRTWSSRYDRFGYVQRGYDNDRMCEELERSYLDWQRVKDRADRLKAEPKQAKQAEPKPDRRILLALG